jgi:hypothetical protein
VSPLELRCLVRRGPTAWPAGCLSDGNLFGTRARSAAVKPIVLALLLSVPVARAFLPEVTSWLSHARADGRAARPFLPEAASSPSYARSDGLTPWDWRRTRDGWQRAEWLMPSPAQQKPPLHPSVVATLELLLSIGALAAFPVRRRGTGEVVRGSGSSPAAGAESNRRAEARATS